MIKEEYLCPTNDDVWTYEFNEETNLSVIYGHDMMNIKFPVFAGRTDFYLNSSESEWLMNTWNKYNYKTIYNNVKNNICPICNEATDCFEYHHAIPASEGGSDDDVNMVGMCERCHSIITKARYGDADIINEIVFGYLFMTHGINFFLMNPDNNKRYPKRSSYLYELRPDILEIKTHIESKDDNKKLDDYYRTSGEFMYTKNQALLMDKTIFDKTYLDYLERCKEKSKGEDNTWQI